MGCFTTSEPCFTPKASHREATTEQNQKGRQDLAGMGAWEGSGFLDEDESEAVTNTREERKKSTAGFGRGYAGRVPLHVGYWAQPQNWVPAFAPFRAVRNTMIFPQVGQAGGCWG